VSQATGEITEVETNRRPDIEHDLDEVYHVTWRYSPGLQSASFDLTRSKHNQVRFEPLVQETVDRYTACMVNGDIFPPIWAWRPIERGKLVIIDGNHRYAAHVATGTPIDVYVIDRETDPRVIALMGFAANRKHGLLTTTPEAVQAAMFLMSNHTSIEQAAATLSVDVREVRKAIKLAKADERADDVGLKRNEWDDIGAPAKARLITISTDEGFRAAATLTRLANLSLTEVSEMVPQINDRGRSGVKQEALVKKLTELYRDRIQAKVGGAMSSKNKRPKGPKSRMNSALGQIMALPDDLEVMAKDYAPPERQKAAERLREAGGRLLSLADTLAPVK
jgi:hypothetical protein